MQIKPKEYYIRMVSPFSPLSPLTRKVSPFSPLTKKVSPFSPLTSIPTCNQWTYCTNSIKGCLYCRKRTSILVKRHIDMSCEVGDSVCTVCEKDINLFYYCVKCKTSTDYDYTQEVSV